MARQYPVPERMIVVAVGPRAILAPQLERRKLGPVEVRDTEAQLP